MILRTTLSAVLLLTIVAPAPTDDSKVAPVKVPFEMLTNGRMISGHLAVQVKVNGKGPYRLVFDTGAPAILLSTRVGKEAGLIGGDKKPPRPAGLMYPGMIGVSKLEVGALVTKDLAAVVIDHPTIKAIGEVFGPIDGIVGFPFFARYRTTIDYQAKELTFTPNGFHPPDVMQAMMTALLGQRGQGKEAAKPLILAPAAQWGMRVEKGEGDAAGVTIAEVFAGSAAAKAGVTAGDRLLTVDGRWTDTVNDCYRAAEAVQPDQRVEIVINRAGKEVKLAVMPVAGQ